MTVNLFDPEWQERDRAGFRYRFASIGDRLGAEELGAAVFELPPGQRTLYHAHHGNEELALVLEGAPTLRTAAGERELAAGGCVLFRRGVEHGFCNRSDELARYVVFSTMIEPDIVEYPDSGKFGLFAGAAPKMGAGAPLEVFLDGSAGRDYYDGETPGTG